MTKRAAESSIWSIPVSGKRRSTVVCPVDAQSKAWIETRMAWLSDEFGWDRLLSTQVILPLEEYFPDPYNQTTEDVQRILERVCGYMGIRSQSVMLSFYVDQNPVREGDLQNGTAGLYAEEDGRYRIAVETRNLTDPLALVATMAHELGHVHLLGHRRISSEVEDHELLTDLLTVFLGMGVFTANSVIRESYWEAGSVAGWSISRRGYLTMPMFGYALALFAWARGEQNPPWSKRLRPDVREAFQQGSRFLAETGDSAFGPDHGDKRRHQQGPKRQPQGSVPNRPPMGRRDKNKGSSRRLLPKRLQCHYCGKLLDPGSEWVLNLSQATGNQELPICELCAESIEENCQDIEREGLEREVAREGGQKILNAGLKVTLAIVVLFVLLCVFVKFK
jgi:hypothetical protein